VIQAPLHQPYSFKEVVMSINRLFLAAASVFLLALGACSSSQPEAPQENAPATQQDPDFSNRPDWTMNEPGVEDGQMSFVGLSAIHANEKNARDDARRSAVDAAVQYLGTIAKNKFEQASVSYGLATEVVDPTTSARTFQKQVSANVARRLKTQKWYMERESDASGKRGYKYFVLATVPMEELDESFKQTARQNIADAQKRAKEAATAQAKKQAEDAASFWADMEKQGLTE
jgi:hypothetical protein